MLTIKKLNILNLFLKFFFSYLLLFLFISHFILFLHFKKVCLVYNICVSLHRIFEFKFINLKNYLTFFFVSYYYFYLFYILFYFYIKKKYF